MDKASINFQMSYQDLLSDNQRANRAAEAHGSEVKRNCQRSPATRRPWKRLRDVERTLLLSLQLPRRERWCDFSSAAPNRRARRMKTIF
jgi:hypothetical protein